LLVSTGQISSRRRPRLSRNTIVFVACRVGNLNDAIISNCSRWRGEILASSMADTDDHDLNQPVDLAFGHCRAAARDSGEPSGKSEGRGKPSQTVPFMSATSWADFVACAVQKFDDAAVCYSSPWRRNAVSTEIEKLDSSKRFYLSIGHCSGGSAGFRRADREVRRPE